MITNHTDERVAETSADDREGTDKENAFATPGVGVVRILSFELKGKVINISRYLKTMPHNDPRHIRMNFPAETQELFDYQLGRFGEQLDRERKVFQGLAQSKIVDRMVGGARNLGMTFRAMNGEIQVVGTFTQLCTSWKQDNISDEGQKHMHSVCVGCFEKNWDQEMEVDMMKSYGIRYNATTSGRSKGCLSIIISYERSKLVKRVNKRSVCNKHEERNTGNKIRVTRTVQERELVGNSRGKARMFLSPKEVSDDGEKGARPPYCTNTLIDSAQG
jgi:hypothetical protein